jgi:hypothetical protein
MRESSNTDPDGDGKKFNDVSYIFIELKLSMFGFDRERDRAAKCEETIVTGRL